MALEKAPHSSVFPELACTHGSHLLRWGGVGLQDQSSAERNLNGACSSHEPLLPVQPAPAHSQGDTHTLFCPELASYFQETPSFMPHCGAVRGGHNSLCHNMEQSTCSQRRRTEQESLQTQPWHSLAVLSQISQLLQPTIPLHGTPERIRRQATAHSQSASCLCLSFRQS